MHGKQKFRYRKHKNELGVREKGGKKCRLRNYTARVHKRHAVTSEES